VTRTIRTLALSCLVLFTTVLHADVVATAPTPLAPLNMEDQYERPRHLSGYRGHVVVLIYGDRASADANKKLGEAVHVHFHPSARDLPPEKALQAPALPLEGVPAGTTVPDVVALPIACVGKVPGFVRIFVRGQIRNGSPYMPVWLDFEDQMKTRFGLAPGAPNVAIVDSQGRLRYTGNGTMNPEQLAQMIQEITALRYEGAQGK
jgi:hypothetical protein